MAPNSTGPTVSNPKKALKAVRTRVIRAMTEQNPAGLLTKEAEREAASLADVIIPENDHKAAFWLGMFHWLRYGALPAGTDRKEFVAAADLLAWVYAKDPEVVPAALRRRYEQDQDDIDADDALAEMIDRGLDLVRAYRADGELSSLTEAVSSFRAAVAATSPGHADHAMCLSNLGSALRMLAGHTGNPVLLGEAVETHRAAVAATPESHPDSAPYLSNLGNALASSFEDDGDVEQLVEAVAASRAAAQAVSDDDPDRSGILSSLAAHLTTLFGRVGGNLDLLDEALTAHRAAVAATPADHPERGTRMSSLGSALQARYQQVGDLDLLAEAVRIHRSAEAATPSTSRDYGTVLSNFAAALTALSEWDRDPDVLQEAVRTGRAAAAADPIGHHDHAMCLSNLGSALQRQFERSGTTALLTEAIDLQRTAVNLSPEGNPERGGYLSNLGSVLYVRFEVVGDPALLEEAVEMHRAAVEATPDDCPDRAGYLSNLGLALHALFERTGETSWLEEAAEAHRAGVDTTPLGHTSRPGHLNNLAAALQELAERAESTQLLVGAVKVHRAAVEATPAGHHNLGGHLSNLALALQALSERTGEPGPLVEAIQIHRAAVDVTPVGHPQLAQRLSNLAIALPALHERALAQDPRLLEEAVSVLRTAVDLASADHPAQATYLFNLGNALQVLSKHGGEGNLLSEANDCYTQVSENNLVSPVTRISAYRQMARLAESDGVGALAAIEAAIDLLPQVTPRTLLRPDREYQLGQLSGLAADAAAAALSAGKPERAVELLEQTRGILVADTLQAHTSDLTRLRASSSSLGPELAREFENLRDRLDVVDRPGPEITSVKVTATLAFGHDHAAASRATEDRVQARRDASAAWEELIQRIRAVDEDFLQPQRIDQLADQARHGPVVLVYTSPTRCDALLLRHGVHTPVLPVPLHDLTEEDTYRQANRLLELRRVAGDKHADPRSRIAAQDEITNILAWMWDTIASPILTALSYTTAPTADVWPRLWWCPVGILAYLPLHAAGHHKDLAADDLALSSNPRTVLDRVISSYATTMRGLAYARTHQPDATLNTTVIVAVPDVPGDPDIQPLSNVPIEADALTEQTPGAHILPNPTHDNVLAALQDHRVAHLACHGQVNWIDPAASRLILPDYKTSPLTVADITGLRLNAGLAYLSACETTVTGQRLADEAVHLTGAFHLAGYQHVIGTLWTVYDVTAKELALEVYTQLTQDGATPPDTDLAAHALHNATRSLRARYPNSPTAWAAYTHTGA
jgi:CHAT domain-containing protein